MTPLPPPAPFRCLGLLCISLAQVGGAGKDQPMTAAAVLAAAGVVAPDAKKGGAEPAAGAAAAAAAAPAAAAAQPAGKAAGGPKGISIVNRAKLLPTGEGCTDGGGGRTRGGAATGCYRCLSWSAQMTTGCRAPPPRVSRLPGCAASWLQQQDGCGMCVPDHSQRIDMWCFWARLCACAYLGACISLSPAHASGPHRQCAASAGPDTNQCPHPPHHHHPLVPQPSTRCGAVRRLVPQMRPPTTRCSGRWSGPRRRKSCPRQ